MEFDSKFQRRMGREGEVIREQPKGSLNAGQPNHSSTIYPTHQWIQTMESFRGALMNMHHVMGGPSPLTKVALVDDGVDINKFNKYLYASIQGNSYGGDTKAPLPWWESNTSHGTLMANMITRINPFVTLDVIKVEGKFRPKGTADAINAAVARGADVISMSWTIELPKITTWHGKPTLEGLEAQDLSSAVKNALKDNRRVLFCAATDKAHLVGNDTLPYSAGQSKIFCIGSSTAYLKRDKGSGDGGYIDYFLPGKNVAEARPPYSNLPEVVHSGSSISTALAAGLASLIIHCAEYAEVCNKEMAKCGKWKFDVQKYRRWAYALRDPYWMRKAFENIRRSQEREDPKILPVWSVFGTWAERLEYARSKEEKVIELNGLVDFICHGFD